jgi:hypothetical protein
MCRWLTALYVNKGHINVSSAKKLGEFLVIHKATFKNDVPLQSQVFDHLFELEFVRLTLTTQHLWMRCA